MSDTNPVRGKPPTQILMDCMEQFGVAEPEHVFIVWVDVEGDVWIKSNARKTMAIGMLEMAKDMVLHPVLD